MLLVLRLLVLVPVLLLMLLLLLARARFAGRVSRVESALGDGLVRVRRRSGLALGAAPAKNREISWFPAASASAFFLGGIVVN